MARRLLTSLWILFTLLWITGCEQLQLDKMVQEPTLRVQNIAVSQVNLNSVGLNLTMNVANPNNYALALAGYDYRIRFNDRELVKGSTDQGFRVPANQSSQVTVPFTVGFREVKQLIDSMGASNTLRYEVDADMRLDAPVLNLFNIKSHKKGEITIPQLPQVSFGDLQVKSFNFTEADIRETINSVLEPPLESARESYANQTWWPVVEVAWDGVKSGAPPHEILENANQTAAKIYGNEGWWASAESGVGRVHGWMVPDSGDEILRVGTASTGLVGEPLQLESASVKGDIFDGGGDGECVNGEHREGVSDSNGKCAASLQGKGETSSIQKATNRRHCDYCDVEKPVKRLVKIRGRYYCPLCLDMD